MRGKGGLAGGRTVEHGITPAYAGKASGAMSGSDMDRITPRVCGKKLQSVAGTSAQVGSPPRMRGKGYDVVSRLCRVRITPACAGKSIIEATSRALNEDHPRVCGEKNSASVIRNCKQGSPPRMRGKGEGQGNSHQERRITPAYAGKSRIRRACTDRHRDHPRMCGEKCEAYARIHGMVGSPPRMRGKALENGGGSLDVRITPACAGKRVRQ